MMSRRTQTAGTRHWIHYFLIVLYDCILRDISQLSIFILFFYFCFGKALKRLLCCWLTQNSISFLKCPLEALSSLITIGIYLSAFWRNKYDFISSHLSVLPRLLFQFFIFVQFFFPSFSSPPSSDWESSIFILFVLEKLIFNLSYTCSRFSRFCCFAFLLSHSIDDVPGPFSLSLSLRFCWCCKHNFLCCRPNWWVV